MKVCGARGWAAGLGFVFILDVAGAAWAQNAANVQQNAPTAGKQPAPTSTAGRAGDVLTIAPVYVTAEKRLEAAQDVPESITVITGQTIQDAGITQIDQAARYVPNLTISEFTSQRLSFPFIRGIGSGRNSPAVTTYIDGVPQLSFASSNQQLVDIDRIEFLRGPQGTLYGRNTLGGVININTRRPSNAWTADGTFTYGNYELQDYRGVISGPLVKDQLYISISGGYTTREGYTENSVTGHDLDGREDTFGRLQLLWTPTKEWEIRFSLGGEHDHDGDYALNDLAQVRKKPFHVTRDFEGFSRRDLYQPSLVVSYSGREVDFTSITAYQFWRSHDRTDLDYTALDLIRRDNKERQKNFYEEIRLSSAKDHPLVLSKEAKLSWLVGASGFTSDYIQNAANEFRPASVAVLGLPAPMTSFENASLSDWGLGVFGQATLTLWDKLDLTAGIRYDYEQKGANLDNFTSLAPTFGTSVHGDDSFDQFSPQFSLGYHATKDILLYTTYAKGYKSGGFNAQAPTGQERFDEEKSWSYEAGVKTSWLNNRLLLNADFFCIDWSDLQLDTPTAVPGQFFISNAGRASSKGFEIEAVARPIDGLDLFAGLGFVDAKFRSGSRSSGRNVGGHDLPFAPETTWNIGAQYTLKLNGDIRTYLRAEVLGTGKYFYDASNAASQDSYVLTNFRLGLGGKSWRVEAWINNAFNEHYEPLAFPFALAPSGYVAEAGAPRTYGITLGLSY